MSQKVDGFLREATKWKSEMKLLRTILLDGGLNEEFKWGKPCYTFQGTNLVLIIGFKETCALLLCQGALINDHKRVLVRPTENTQAARQIRFKNVREIVELKDTLKDYIKQAVEAEKSGLKVKYKTIAEFKIPEEFQTQLDENPRLKAAFASLTPGRQRAYLLYFSGAKHSKTRVERVERYRKQILNGKGLNDE